MGRTRYQTNTIDIGAYEYARMKAGRIRYVKPKKVGTGDGSSWENATNDIQGAINDLAEKATTPGEKRRSLGSSRNLCGKSTNP